MKKVSKITHRNDDSQASTFLQSIVASPCTSPICHIDTESDRNSDSNENSDSEDNNDGTLKR